MDVQDLRVARVKKRTLMEVYRRAPAGERRKIYRDMNTGRIHLDSTCDGLQQVYPDPLQGKASFFDRLLETRKGHVVI